MQRATKTSLAMALVGLSALAACSQRGPTTVMPGSPGPSGAPAPGSTPAPTLTATATPSVTASPGATASGSPRSGPSGSPPVATAPAAGAYSGIFPDTSAELAALEVAVQQGHQPWRSDPKQVASAYLASIGVAGAQVGDFVPEEQLGGVVKYTAGAAGGGVTVARLASGQAYYVIAALSPRLQLTRQARQGQSLTLEVSSPVAGSLAVKSRPLDGTFGPDTTTRFDAAGHATVTLRLTGTGPVVVHLRHDGVDHVVSVSELRVAA